MSRTFSAPSSADREEAMENAEYASGIVDKIIEMAKAVTPPSQHTYFGASPTLPELMTLYLKDKTGTAYALTGASTHWHELVTNLTALQKSTDKDTWQEKCPAHFAKCQKMIEDCIRHINDLKYESVLAECGYVYDYNPTIIPEYEKAIKAFGTHMIGFKSSLRELERTNAWLAACYNLAGP